ncbi:G patch domain-containing protein 8 [Selaginella moellendorffii]|uniref:G patch domain-containing protein 8 n=1 Tax=Selaginella moellendorffii TaxID=88036 RepID=UPI000D1D1027|nr:G patch domain-containing protein 8 [Selaginella moellendorffii]|eukprot:XP_024545046.1 G patch domain-containing protein 8 [Selaginella moellendorffii]
MEAAARSEGSTSSASSEPQSMLAQGDEPLIRAAESRVTDILQQFVRDVEARIASSLKEAASDVVSHLGKEAASRLVAAERKVAFLEQELVGAKEQALSMLLRLKHHTDSQILDLEKLLVAERRRADDAEAKVAALHETLRRAKRKGGGECTSGRGGGVKHSHSGEATVNQEEMSDSLALIAGVACDVMQQPKNNNEQSDQDNDCSSLSEKLRNSEELEGDERESPSHNASVAANVSTRKRKRKSRSIAEERQRQPEASADEHKSEDEEDNDDDDASVENGDSSERKRPASARQQRNSKRKSRQISTSEKLTRLMVGSKRARGKAGRADKKSASVPESSSRDSRRLMQGARQLFSMAEKKW